MCKIILMILYSPVYLFESQSLALIREVSKNTEKCSISSFWSFHGSFRSGLLFIMARLLSYACLLLGFLLVLGGTLWDLCFLLFVNAFSILVSKEFLHHNFELIILDLPIAIDIYLFDYVIPYLPVSCVFTTTEHSLNFISRYRTWSVLKSKNIMRIAKCY